MENSHQRMLVEYSGLLYPDPADEVSPTDLTELCEEKSVKFRYSMIMTGQKVHF